MIIKHLLHFSVIALAIIFTNTLVAQNLRFDQVSANPPNSSIIANFDGVEDAQIAQADIDSDGDIDILVAGINSYSSRSVRLYKNDGKGNFTWVKESGIELISGGSIAFLDSDQDGDQDIVLTGINQSSTYIAKQYFNDGKGNFTESADPPFEAVILGKISTADVNNDKLIDLLVTGSTPTNKVSTVLYLNAGKGVFTAQEESPFEATQQGATQFLDVDGDKDQDLFITGINTLNYATATLYLNDGKGNFKESTDKFMGVYNSSIDFADIDSDGTVELLITGANQSNEPSTILYKKSEGKFIDSRKRFARVKYSSVKFADIDNDNDMDLLITGAILKDKSIAVQYENDGAGNFSRSESHSLAGVRKSAIIFLDMDSDKDLDLLLTGEMGYHERVAKLYQNNNGVYSECTGTPFERVSGGSITFVDIDQDNDKDLFITGMNEQVEPTSCFYRNDGLGNFSCAPELVIPGIFGSAVSFADIDNDGDQDAFVSGQKDKGLMSKLYLNDGNGGFIEKDDVTFDPISNGSVLFADLDNDTDLDLFITGGNGTSPATSLYLNDGSGGYSKVEKTPFTAVTYASVAANDIDRDGDIDLLVSGYDSDGMVHSTLYLNAGKAIFIKKLETNFENLGKGSITFIDIDNDKDQDVLMTGETAEKRPSTTLYTNDGKGNYAQVAETPFDNARDGGSLALDANSDGNMDVLIMGRNDANHRIAKLYTNDGAGNFTESETNFEGNYSTAAAAGDVDADGDLDVLISGNGEFGQAMTKLYKNGLKQ